MYGSILVEFFKLYFTQVIRAQGGETKMYFFVVILFILQVLTLKYKWACGPYLHSTHTLSVCNFIINYAINWVTFGQGEANWLLAVASYLP